MQFVTSKARRKQYGIHTHAGNSLTPGLSKTVPQSTMISLRTNISHLTSYSAYKTPCLALKNSTFCPHSVFVCFVWISEQTAIISLYSINWLVCITETECVYCAVGTGYLNVIWVICFIWIWEQTAIISLYSINWLVCVTETECLLRGTDWVFKCNLGYMLYMDPRTNSYYFPIQHLLTDFYNRDGVFTARYGLGI